MASERTLWKHTLYSVANHLVHTALALAKISWSVETLTARITGITCVYLVGFLLTSKYHLRGVDKDYVVSTVYMRSE